MAQQENGEYFEQQTDPTLSNNALNQTPVIQASEIEQENEAIRMEQEEIARAIELSNQESGEPPKVEFNKNPLMPDESSEEEDA